VVSGVEGNQFEAAVNTFREASKIEIRLKSPRSRLQTRGETAGFAGQSRTLQINTTNSPDEGTNNLFQRSVAMSFGVKNSISPDRLKYLA
jgi:hypothetical protein